MLVTNECFFVPAKALITKAQKGKEGEEIGNLGKAKNQVRNGKRRSFAVIACFWLTYCAGFAFKPSHGVSRLLCSRLLSLRVGGNFGALCGGSRNFVLFSKASLARDAPGALAFCVGACL